MLLLVVIVTWFLGAQAQSEEENITSYGYPFKSYDVTTSDGYILKVFRIPHGKNPANRNGKVAFLMHGLIASYNSFTLLGPEYAMAYNLADAGYDVWMGNARGNKYSRRHVSLNPDNNSKQFFDFTYEEIGLYDLPAMVDFALATTNQTKLHYVGHSQGGTVFFVLNSMNTTYQSKFASAHLLAGIGYQKQLPNKPIKLFSLSIDAIYPLTLQDDFVELKPDTRLTTILTDTLVNATTPQALIAGAAVKQGAHYSQNFRDEAFRRWNYDSATNVHKYGQATPPWYDLSKIKVNVTMHYSLGDITQSESDVLDMVAAMPHATARKVTNSSFNHIDYLANKDVKALVTDYIIDSFNNS